MGSFKTDSTLAEKNSSVEDDESFEKEVIIEILKIKPQSVHNYTDCGLLIF